VNAPGKVDSAALRHAKDRGTELLAQGLLEEALAAFLEVVKAVPDEPIHRQKVAEVLQRMGIFVSSHLLNEVERTCTHIAIIRKGRILTQGSLDELVRGASVARLRSDDHDALLRALGEYQGTVNAVREGSDIVVELRDHDLAALNRFLFERNVHLSHLASQRQSLEDVFIGLTGDRPDLAPGEAA
jgi:ABC-type uncharacterized transport system ATPase subunit